MDSKKKIFLIIASVIVAVVIALVLFYRYCPVGVSLSITFSSIVSFVGGYITGWLLRKKKYEGK